MGRARTASSAVTHPEHAGRRTRARDGTHHARRARTRTRARWTAHARRDNIAESTVGALFAARARHVRHRVRVAVRGRRRVVSNARARDADGLVSRVSRPTSSSSRGARLAHRALSDDDTVIVTGALERLAQCAAVRLRENEKSAGARVVASLPREAFEGVKNPRDVRSKELVYPNADALRALRAAGAEPIGEDEEAMRAALREATCVVFAEETPKKLRATVEATMKRVDAGDAPRLRRVVLLSRVGVERRDAGDPWKYMNRKTFRGGAPLTDAWEAEEAVRARAAKTVKAGGVADGWTYTVVRTGELRGNGPTTVVYADYALTLVDNAFDVRMQDVEVKNGDTMGPDYTNVSAPSRIAC